MEWLKRQAWYNLLLFYIEAKHLEHFRVICAFLKHGVENSELASEFSRKDAMTCTMEVESDSNEVRREPGDKGHPFAIPSLRRKGYPEG